ncbi:MAG: hypothetical protein KKA79_02480 [Nanoarchaeota archaeon]|nr:hypothetical protein [Nanoarchaeota archaeon]MCG2718193.1 hypothetical protein [Nanoarchaeota archaeon]
MRLPKGFVAKGAEKKLEELLDDYSNRSLFRIAGGYDRFNETGKLYNQAVKISKGIIYDQFNLEEFCKILYKLTNDCWAGNYVSALVNKIIKPEDTFNLEFPGDLVLDGLGTALKQGKVYILGDAGYSLGYHMYGGELCLRGNAAYLVGHNMLGGKIVVDGDAGDQAGFTMQGGEIIINGNAGKETGYDMDDGLITIHGDVVQAGWKLNGGKIMVHGKIKNICGDHDLEGEIYEKGVKVWPL